MVGGHVDVGGDDSVLIVDVDVVVVAPHAHVIR